MILGVPINLALGIGVYGLFLGIPLETWESLRLHRRSLWKRVLQALGMFVLYNAIAIFLFLVRGGLLWSLFYVHRNVEKVL